MKDSANLGRKSSMVFAFILLHPEKSINPWAIKEGINKALGKEYLRQGEIYTYKKRFGKRGLIKRTGINYEKDESNINRFLTQLFFKKSGLIRYLGRPYNKELRYNFKLFLEKNFIRLFQLYHQIAEKRIEHYNNTDDLIECCCEFLVFSNRLLGGYRVWPKEDDIFDFKKEKFNIKIISEYINKHTWFQFLSGIWDDIDKILNATRLNKNEVEFVKLSLYFLSYYHHVEDIKLGFYVSIIPHKRKSILLEKIDIQLIRKALEREIKKGIHGTKKEMKKDMLMFTIYGLKQRMFINPEKIKKIFSYLRILGTIEKDLKNKEYVKAIKLFNKTRGLRNELKKMKLLSEEI